MYENPRGQWKGLDEYRKLISRAENAAAKSVKPKLNAIVKEEVNKAIAKELSKRGIETNEIRARKTAWDTIGRGKGKAAKPKSRPAGKVIITPAPIPAPLLLPASNEKRVADAVDKMNKLT